MRRWRRWLGAGALGLVLAGGMAFFWALPALAAVGCPSCYGLEPAAPGVPVERAMPEEGRRRLLADAGDAAAAVALWFGETGTSPVLLACVTEDCDRRLGGLGARAVTYSTPVGTVIRLSPRGLDRVILTHELSHVALHGRVGLLRVLTGALPTWFDEGVAVVVSEDARYLRPGDMAAARCRAEPSGALPETPRAWNRVAGRQPMLYAEAACGVLRWMERHGGRAGLSAALDALAEGRGTLP